jgi:acetoin utilization protein AcuB
MDRHQPVRNLMTRDPVTVQITDKPSRVRALLAQHAFHHLPVCNGKQLVGIVSGADLWPHTFDGYVPDGATVDAWLDQSIDLQGIITHEPETVSPTDSVVTAAGKLADGDYHALPVVEPDGTLAGILTTTDLLRLFVAAP